jgi:Protein of unknown function (DUF3800)
VVKKRKKAKLKAASAGKALKFSMSWFLFIDESGHDRGEAPYEVLAGIAIQDRHLWKFILDIHAAEERNFGRRYSEGAAELKGRKILKTKVFRHTELNCQVAIHEIVPLAKSALDDGARAGIRELKALALAKLAYVDEVLDICQHYGCRAFASVVETDAPRTTSGGLRKDYAYLFQRFYYFLDECEPKEQGLIVFDELEKSQSHILIEQTHKYFKETATGRSRSNLVIPEPLFVHSDLTTGIQVADLIAYCVSWGFRTNHMRKPARGDLASRYGQKVANLRHVCDREINGTKLKVWSYAHITDLRTRSERELDE